MEIYPAYFLVSVCTIFWLAEAAVADELCRRKDNTRLVQAVCRLQPNPSQPPNGITGTILLSQRVRCDNPLTLSQSPYPLNVRVKISGMPTNGNPSKHGLHVHKNGRMLPNCEAMGGHYNPFGTYHGTRGDSVYHRHIGDFGNVYKDANGEVSVFFTDNIAKLVGPYSIMGRGIVVTSGEDDLGRAHKFGMTGNAGKRLACCVIQPLQRFNY